MSLSAGGSQGTEAARNGLAGRLGVERCVDLVTAVTFRADANTVCAAQGGRCSKSLHALLIDSGRPLPFPALARLARAAPDF
ncbi:hypothetical protein M8818_001516 [Zalaria obscura]|uniref:Uncharacterized protein n=1 Tax=Zalaria obscura TaxID=2024903 RepID=A0ACC3SLZ0_9PEZI